MKTATPPADRRDLVAAAEPRGRALYFCVRQLIDELEVAAPWSLLQTPSTDRDELRMRIGRLLELVQGAPARITNELDDLTSSGELFGREARAEAEFYFGALHQMTTPNRRLLAAAIERLPEGAPLSRAAADDLAELAADLKGEYASAMMGAAAALLSNGRWLGVEVETTLFPEKAEERLRNRRLLAALNGASRDLAALRAGFPWREVLETWRRRQPVDRYALGELVSVRAHLLPLLQVTNRQALFSGDYRLLKKREILLGSRLREIEELHLASLDLAADSPAGSGAATFDRLCQLLLEIAAVLDLELLRDLIGGDALRRLRAAGRPAGAEGTPQAPDPLAFLLAEEDLTIFLHLLLGAVTKRQSIAFEGSTEPARRAPAQPAPVEPEAGPAEPPAARAGASRPARAGQPDTRRIHDRLETTLARLLDPGHEPWRAFQMVQKLQTRLRVLPPTLTAEMLPFLADLRNELLPRIEEATAIGLLPATAAENLRACDQRLAARDFSHPATGPELGDDLARVVRLLRSLDTAVTARQGEPPPAAGRELPS